MSWMNSIISWLANARDYFLDAYYTVRGWVYPFYYLASPLYYIYSAFSYLVIHFGSFNTWLVWAAGRINQILDITQLTSAFSTFITYATNAWNWVANATTNVRLFLDTWWREASQQVFFLIEQAKYWMLAQLNNLAGAVATIITWWNSFVSQIPTLNEIILWFQDWRGKIVATILSWGGIPAKEIALLIDSKLKEWFPFYDDLANLWGGIKLFFADPEKWLYEAVDRIFERFW